MADADTAPAKKSDLGVRTLSAIVMLAITLTALWLGGFWIKAFILAVALATFVELVRLVLRTQFSQPAKAAGTLLGAVYIGAAAYLLIDMIRYDILLLAVTVLIVVIADVGAYFTGRKFGKRKIAPSISPSKTWAGLYGAMIGCALFVGFISFWMLALASAFSNSSEGVSAIPVLIMALIGAALAVLAQAGDFLESWLKRKAGMKDSSNLIPGHGGVFDRTDGLIPVAIAVALLSKVFNI